MPNSSQTDKQVVLNKKSGDSRFSRTDIVDGLVHLEGISSASGKRILQQIVDIMWAALLSGDVVHIPNLGSFRLDLKPPRKVTHPITLEPQIATHSLKIKFRPSTTLSRTAKEHADIFLERALENMNPEERAAYDAKLAEVQANVEESRKEFYEAKANQSEE